jgi:hypothetical protein
MACFNIFVTLSYLLVNNKGNWLLSLIRYWPHRKGPVKWSEAAFSVRSVPKLSKSRHTKSAMWRVQIFPPYTCE